MTTRLSGECEVYTTREGALAAVGHDLVLELPGFEVEYDAASGALTASLDPKKLRVRGAMLAGREDRQSPDPKDRRTIERHVADDILEIRRHPSIRFEGKAVLAGADWEVTGKLTLHGTTRPLSFTAHPKGTRLEAELVLSQLDFGIKPFRAFLGALRVTPAVRLRLSVQSPQARHP